MISYTGEVKLIDFGIAKLANDASAKIAGRFTYGAPEMLTDPGADARADLYGLGVVLWSLIAHRRDPHPFLRDRHPTAPAEDATIEAPPSPSTFNWNVPRELDAVVMRALAYLPEDRYQTANEFRTALAPFIPKEFVGEEELKRFLRRHSDADRDRDRLAMLVKKALPLLDELPPPSPLVDLPPADPIIVTPSADVIAFGDYGTIPHVPIHDFSALADAKRNRPEFPPLKRRSVFAITFGCAMVFGLVLGGYAVRLHRSPPAPTIVPLQNVHGHTTVQTFAPPTEAVLQPEAQPLPFPTVADAPTPTVRRPLPKPSRPVAVNRARSPDRMAIASEELRSARDSYEREELSAALKSARDAARNGAGAPAYVIIGKVLSDRGDLNGAQDAFAQAVKRAPADREAMGLLHQARRVISEQSASR